MFNISAIKDYLEEFIETKKIKKFNITKKKQVEIKLAIANATEHGLKIEDILVFKDYNKEVEFNRDALNELMTDITLIKQPQNSQCYFIKGNNAWVNQDPKTLICRYFSFNPSTRELFHLSIIDIYKNMTGLNYGEAVTRLLGAYTYYTSEERRKELIRNNYRNNLMMIEKLTKEQNPEVSYLISNHRDLLSLLNLIGLRNINGDAYLNDNGKPVFFTSTRYLEGEYGLSHSQIARILTLFSLIGIIEKVKIEEVPEILKDKAYSNTNGNSRKCIGFYTIPTLTDEMLVEFENRASWLKEKGINKRNLSYNRLIELLGQDIANDAYPNK